MSNIDISKYLADAQIAANDVYNNSSQRKSDRLQERTASKQERIGTYDNLVQTGYFDPTQSVVSSNNFRTIDGDTFDLGRDHSTRILGSDTYESTKSNYSQWIADPKNQDRMNRQVAALTAATGTPATYADVFAAGDKQKAEADAVLHGNLPVMLQETLLQNAGTHVMKNGKPVNYGRDLGHYTTLGGQYSNPDGTTGNGAIEVLGSNEQQALADMQKYGTAKYAGDTSEHTAANFVPVTSDDGFFDSLLRVPQAMLAGAGKSTYDLADTAVEAVGNIAARGAEATGFDSIADTVDKMDIATDKEKTSQVNSLIGYDNKHSDSIMKESGDKYVKAMKDVDLFSPSTWGNIDTEALGDSITTALSTPETAGYSFGYLAPALMGILEKGAVKLLSVAGQQSAKKVATIASSKTLSKAAKRKRIAATTRNMSLTDKSKMVLADHADALGYGAMMTNDQLDEVMVANGGERESLFKVGSMLALNAAGMKLDMASARAITTGPGAADKLVTALKGMGKTKATQVMAAVTAYAAKLGAAGLTEMPQEFTQSYIEAFNKAYGVKQADGTKMSAKEAALSEEVRTEAGQGAIAGLTSAPYMTAGASVVGKVKEGLGLAVGKAGESLQARKDAKAVDTGWKTPESIPDEDLGSAVEAIHEAEAGIERDEEQPYNREAHAAAVVKIDEREAPIAELDTDDVANLQEGQTAEILQETAKGFDHDYAMGMEVLKEQAAMAVDNGITDVHPNFVEFVKQGIGGLQADADAVLAAGGTNKAAAMQAKIDRLIPLLTANTTQELSAILNAPGMDDNTKIAQIMGSSATSTEDIDNILKSTEPTEKQKKLLELKRQTIIDVAGVKEQKLTGGGAKPGVMQWAAMLMDGKENPAAIKRINNFADGQRTKLKEFQKVIDDWDVTNGMEWTKEGNTKVYPHSDTTLQNKMHLRSNSSINSKLSSPITYKGSTYKDIGTIANLANEMENEQVRLDELQALANDTSPAAQQGAQETQTGTKGKDTSVAPVTPSAPAEDAPGTGEGPMTGQERRDNQNGSIARDIASGNGIAKDDFQHYEANKAAIDELVASINEANKPTVEDPVDTSPETPTEPVKAPEKKPEVSTPVKPDNGTDTNSITLEEAKAWKRPKMPDWLTPGKVSNWNKAVEELGAAYKKLPGLVYMADSGRTAAMRRDAKKELDALNKKITARKNTIQTLMKKPKKSDRQNRIEDAGIENSTTTTDPEQAAKDVKNAMKGDPVKVKEEDAETITELDKDYVSPDIDYAAEIAKLDAKETPVKKQPTTEDAIIAPIEEDSTTIVESINTDLDAIFNSFETDAVDGTKPCGI